MANYPNFPNGVQGLFPAFGSMMGPGMASGPGATWGGNPLQGPSASGSGGNVVMGMPPPGGPGMSSGPVATWGGNPLQGPGTTGGGPGLSSGPGATWGGNPLQGVGTGSTGGNVDFHHILDGRGGGRSNAGNLIQQMMMQRMGMGIQHADPRSLFPANLLNHMGIP